MIVRRAVVAGLLSTVGASLGGAQSLHVTRKIGYLHPTTISPDHPTLISLRRAWQALGYVEGKTVLLRSAEGDLSRLPALVGELIALDVGVLIAVGASAVKAARQVTATTPIVAIDLETDPVLAGYAASVARPGANVTGLFMDMSSLAGKWIELLQETIPTIERVAVVWDPTTGRDQLDIAKGAAHAKGIEAVVIEARSADDYEETFRSLGQQKRTGLMQLTAPGSSAAIATFSMVAQKYDLPTITYQKANSKAGALLSYGPIQEVYFPRAIVFADKILKGAKASELPIEQPTTFELVVNLKTAKALGLAVPPSILARADEVIE